MSFDSEKVKQLIDREKVQLSDLRRCLPKEVFQLSATKSSFTVVRIIAMVSLCLWLESLTENLLYLVPLWLIHGQVLVGLFVLAHDCGHGSFSRSRLINSVVGHLAFAPLGNGLVTWQLTHNHHHAHTQKIGQQVDWSKWLRTREEYAETKWYKDFITRLGYTLPFGILSWVGWNAIRRGIKKDNILGYPLTPKQQQAVTLSNFFMLMTFITVYGSLIYFGGFPAALKYHAIPAFIAMVTGYFLLIIQHANEFSLWFEEKLWSPSKGQLASTYDERFPRILEWLWLDINIHIPHHVAPIIPWYNLRAARKTLIKFYPVYYQERRFHPGNVKWMIRTPFIKANSASGTYQLAK